MYTVECNTKDGRQVFVSNNLLVAMMFSCACITKISDPLTSASAMEALEKIGEVRTAISCDGVLVLQDEITSHLERMCKLDPGYTLTIASREQKTGGQPYHVVRYMLEGPTLGWVFDQFYEIAPSEFGVDQSVLGKHLMALENSGQLHHVVTQGKRVLDEEEVVQTLMLEKETGGHA